ncbi:MAG TPA: ATP-binding cassette domain-containing protein, partial [Roseobacter sp.]|nr:ATP-binding cassette domain-containing protein [Roseobacter sp.]
MTFGGLRAVDGMNFDVEQGEILCLLGPNGAGKSTTL